MVFRSHISRYHGNRETIRYGKAARQSMYHYKPFFFFFPHNFKVFITESHEEVWGKQLFVMAEGKRKNKNKEKKLRLLGYLSRKKMPVGGMLQARVHQLHNLN